MKDNSEANNNHDNSNGVGNNNPISWSRKIIFPDDETSSFLNSLKTQLLGRKWINGCESFKNAIKNGSVPEMPELGKPIDGFTPPKLPPVHVLEGLIGECGVPFEKQLTETDMNKYRARLSIAQELVEKFVMPLMSEEERRSLKHRQDIQVTACGSNGIEYPMIFKIRGSNMHVLTSGWNEFRIDNEFKALQDWVTTWVFRHKRTGKLCFGMIPSRGVHRSGSTRPDKSRVEKISTRTRPDYAISQKVSDQPINKGPKEKEKERRGDEQMTDSWSPVELVCKFV